MILRETDILVYSNHNNSKVLHMLIGMVEPRKLEQRLTLVCSPLACKREAGVSKIGSQLILQFLNKMKNPTKREQKFNLR